MKDYFSNAFFRAIAVTVLSLFISLASQAAVQDYSRFISRISPSEGLSQSEVNCIIQDREGFIWIATRLGLNRYDGYSVKKVFGPNSVFTKENILTLHLDQQGFIWLTTSLAGMYRINPVTFESESYYDGRLDANDPTVADMPVIIQDTANSLYFAAGNTVQQIDITTGKVSRIAAVGGEEEAIAALLKVNNRIYIGATFGLYVLDLDSQQVERLNHVPTHIDSDSSFNIQALYLDSSLGLLVGTEEGLFQVPHLRLRGDVSVDPQELMTGTVIWDIVRQGDIYLLGTEKGLYSYHPQTSELLFLLNYSRSKYLTSDDNIQDIFEDTNGNIWLASHNQGAIRWANITTRFMHISALSQPSLSDPDVKHMYQDSAGIIWIATENGLNRYDTNTNDIQYFQLGEMGRTADGFRNTWSIFPNSTDENYLWIANHHGILLFDKTTATTSLPPLGEEAKRILTNEDLRDVHIKDNQHIYFFTTENYYWLDGSTGDIQTLDVINRRIPTDLAWSIMAPLPDQPNSLLISASGHLFRYELHTKQLSTVYKVRNFVPQAFDYVNSWIIDDKGVLWLSIAGEGLIGLDSQSYAELYRFDVTNQLTTNQVFSVQLDQLNHLWVSSKEGLHRIDESRTRIETYQAEDGLQSAEFNTESSLRLRDNRLIFGSPVGITMIEPSRFNVSPADIKDYSVHLSESYVLSEQSALTPIAQSQYLNLKHDQYGLTLLYSTLSYAQQSRTRYSIKLDGPEQFHLHNYTSNKLLLPKLSAGFYHLTITAEHPFYNIRSNPLVLNIEVEHPPWSSPAARLSYFVLFSIAIALVVKQRRQKQRNMLLLHRQTEERREQMQMALYGSQSGVWDYNIKDDAIYQDRLTKELGYADGLDDVSIEEHTRLVTKLIKPEQLSQMAAMWSSFLEGGDEHWEVTYQMRSKSGKWFWYRDVGRVVEWDENGKASRIIGTYTNITETKANEEKAKLFGDAFSQINDWVLILDARYQPVTANDAFMEAFSVRGDNLQNAFEALLVQLSKTKFRMFREILTSLTPKESWQGEEILKTLANTEHPVLIKINAIARQKDTISHFVIVISDITIQKNAEAKLRYLAQYDNLTDLPNRQLFFDSVETKISRSNRAFAILFIDLDKFKQVNDLYGHFIGDQLLIRVANTLRECLQPDDLVARQSGDEFIILLDSVGSMSDVAQIANTILQQLAKTIVIDDLHIHITSSIGVATFPQDSDNTNELIKKADLAMIHAKQSGRGELQFFTQDMNAKVHERILLENDLKEACEQDRFINYYQPIVDCNRHKIVGVELLMRWNNDGNFIPPSVFIPIAEEIGLISKMTINAIEQALNDYQTWATEQPLYISINLSPVHILQGGLSTALVNLLEKHNLPTSVLRLEITESTLLTDLDIALKRIAELRGLGFKLMLDDFGTGYSSMSYLSKFSIDYIKIDRSFINDLDSSANRSIVNSIVSLAKNLKLDCVVEGVEKQEQLDYVRDIGCSLIQGFLYSAPIPSEQLIELQGQRDNFAVKH